MLIKVKKILHALFSTKTHLLSSLEKNKSEKSFFELPHYTAIPQKRFKFFLHCGLFFIHSLFMLQILFIVSHILVSGT